MADDQKPEKQPEKIIAYTGTSAQNFPLKPKTWDYVKEAFQPTDVRAQLDAIRKRKNGDS